MFSRPAMAGEECFTSAAEVEIHTKFDIPKSWTNKKKDMALSGELRHTSKPDIDNLAKSILDGIIGIVIKDDAQISSMHVSKGYAAPNYSGVHVIVRVY